MEEPDLTSSSSEDDNSQHFNYFLVLDFEATCQKESKMEPQEIIEFPCLLVRSSDFNVVDQFHQYVLPVVHPSLSTFCSELTGITQDMLKDCDSFPGVLERFKTWYLGLGLTPETATFVTCGNWDLVTMLPEQCRVSKIPVPTMLDLAESRNFVNIKLTYQEVEGKTCEGIVEMQQGLGLDFQGRLHSGIDDCRNIGRLVEALARRGARFRHNGMDKLEVRLMFLCFFLLLYSFSFTRLRQNLGLLERRTPLTSS